MDKSTLMMSLFDFLWINLNILMVSVFDLLWVHAELLPFEM